MRDEYRYGTNTDTGRIQIRDEYRYGTNTDTGRIQTQDAYKCKSWPGSQPQLSLNPVGLYKAGGSPKDLQLQHVPQSNYSIIHVPKFEQPKLLKKTSVNEHALNKTIQT